MTDGEALAALCAWVDETPGADVGEDRFFEIEFLGQALGDNRWGVTLYLGNTEAAALGLPAAWVQVKEHATLRAAAVTALTTIRTLPKKKED